MTTALARPTAAQRPPGFRGYVVHGAPFATELGVLAKQLPVGTRIRHRSGRTGTVTLDGASHAPGYHAGTPTAWAFTDLVSGYGLVCAAWNNQVGFDRWIIWTPVEYISIVAPSRINRPGLKGGAR